MKTEERDTLIDAIIEHLDTRDKRYMFLKIFFKDLIPRIQIEGSPIETSWNIYSEFDKQQMVGSLMACMNNTFDLDLLLSHK
jgi:excinuclease UvrABC nuclease subunit